ncbi:MAG: AAA family ATPase [bacterium]
MFIKLLQLRRFKKFDELELFFTSGINVIKGPNEEGKSTLVAALLAGLFLDPKSRSQSKVLPLKSWHHEQLFETNTVFVTDANKQYLLQKDFENKEILLRDENKKNEWKTFDEVREIIATETGLSSPELFAATAMIEQDKVAEISSGKKELEKSLQILVTAGQDSANVQDILKSLDKEIKNYNRGVDRPVSNPGLIRKISDELTSVTAEISKEAGGVQTIDKVRSENDELVKRTEQNKKDLDQKKELKDLNLQFRDLSGKLEKYEKDLTDVTTTISELEKINNELRNNKKSLSIFKDWEKRNLDKDEDSLTRLSERVAMAKSIVTEEIKAKRPTWPWLVGGALIVLGLIGLAIYWYTSLLALIGIAVIIFGFTQKSQKQVAIHDKHEADKEDKKLAELLKDLGVKTLEEFKKKKEEMVSIHNKEQELMSERKGILRDRKENDLEKQKTVLARDIAVTEAKITDEMKQAKLSPEEWHKLDKDIEELDRQFRNDREHYEKNLGIIEQYEKSSHDLVAMEERQEQLQGKLDFVKEQEQVLETVKNFMLNSSVDVVKTSKTRLQKNLNEILPTITNGKYKKVEVADDLSFTVFSDEAGDKIVPEKSLSRGAIDQFYLAVRFAFIDLISEGKKPPIILDDPFVTFDKSRRAATMGLLKDLAKDYQIFLFTASDDYDKYANKVIALNG